MNNSKIISKKKLQNLLINWEESKYNKAIEFIDNEAKRPPKKLFKWKGKWRGNFNRSFWS